MKFSKASIIRIKDLLEQIRLLNEMIDFHKSNPYGELMISQYKERRRDFAEQLVDEFIRHNKERSTTVYQLVDQLITKFILTTPLAAPEPSKENTSLELEEKVLEILAA